MLLVSPAEPKVLRALGTVSAECERVGADFLCPTPHGLVGIQRKEIRDLVASIRGDRIAREIGQSTDLYRTVLLVEGDWRWGAGGDSQACPGFSRSQYDGLLLSFQSEGWFVLHSRNLVETAEVLGRIQSWFARSNHSSLRQRPKSRGLWGSASNKEWGQFWWQSFNGIGVGTATNLYEALGVPVVWTVTEKELMAVPGVGKKRAGELLAALTPGGHCGREEGTP